tara:strand:- start:2495 stop:3484 length:990 start_codon:yes stop_codon:yes gene_type:complete
MRHDRARIRNAKIAERVGAGEHPRDLAVEYDLHPVYVYRLAKDAGVSISPADASRKVMIRRIKMVELHSLDISAGHAASLLGVSAQTFSKDCKRIGLKFKYDRAGKWACIIGKSMDRAAKMADMYRGGMTLQQIGDKYGVTRERVRQLMTKHLGINHKDGGQAKQAASKRTQRDAKKDSQYLASHGCTWAQYKEVRDIGHAMVAEGRGVYQTPFRAYASQRWNATDRGIPWDLNFWQWWTIWQESGKWEARGKRRDGYVMSRHRDQGGYAIGNVYIGTLAENSSDQPNNPYRTDHPDHDKVSAIVGKKISAALLARRGKSRPTEEAEAA